MDQLKNEILQIVSNIVEKEPEEIPGDANLVNDVGVDSMMALEIMASLEKKYSILIPEEKLKDLSTVNKIMSLVLESQKSSKQESKK